jgi:uncharacterized protein YceH (UPF0502 family)
VPPILTQNEQRVLGCLLEKEVLTPEAYPLTLNSLKLACNQKTSREPVLELVEEDVSLALYSLRGKNLVNTRTDARATKYSHKLESAAALSGGQRALLTLLLLRGPQTAGELRGRCERMHTFETPADVEQALESLAAYADGPWARRLERRPGEKEARWAQLCGGDEGLDELPVDHNERVPASALDELRRRVDAMEAEVAALKQRAG